VKLGSCTTSLAVEHITAQGCPSHPHTLPSSGRLLLLLLLWWWWRLQWRDVRWEACWALDGLGLLCCSASASAAVRRMPAMVHRNATLRCGRWLLRGRPQSPPH
jgi:hypothetical protein